MKAKPTNKPGQIVLEVNRRDEPMLAAASQPANAASTFFALKKILVPIDFSECSKKALRYAIPLAKEHQAAITLLYVVSPQYAAGEYGGIDYASLETETRASGEQHLARLVVEEVRGEVPADTLVVTCDVISNDLLMSSVPPPARL